MRCYHFCNFYLSGVQTGIQSAHAQMELFVKYRDMTSDDFSGHPECRDDDFSKSYLDYVHNTQQLFDWAENHKTMICLSGGMAADLRSIENIFDSTDNHFPWASFREDEDALDGVLTNVAIVLPTRIYDTASMCRQHKYNIDRFTDDTYCVYETINNGTIRASDIIISEWEFGLINTLNDCRMAS